MNDDERWLNNLSYAATALEASADNGDRYCARLIREHLSAAGFRRTEAPEPRPCLLPHSAPPCVGCSCGVAPEPQGEPSDAQVHAAWLTVSGLVTQHQMRAALRAAGAVR